MGIARKSRFLGDGIISRRLLLFTAGLLPALGHARPWTDGRTGLALAGYDAVSYYESDGPVLGQKDFELFEDGAYWRFRNEGNKAAFLAHPTLYMPQFGGYDMVLLAEGKLTAGHPLLWRTVNDRLYLFFSARQQEQFDAGHDALMAEASREWDRLQKTQY